MAAKTAKTPASKCACGCGKSVTSGRNFSQGHDQRLRGQLARSEPQKPETRAFLKANPGFTSSHGGAVKAKPKAAKVTTRAARPGAKPAARPARRTVPSVELEG